MEKEIGAERCEEEANETAEPCEDQEASGKIGRVGRFLEWAGATVDEERIGSHIEAHFSLAQPVHHLIDELAEERSQDTDQERECDPEHSYGFELESGRELDLTSCQLVDWQTA